MKEEIKTKAQEILGFDLEEGEKIFVDEVEPGIYYAGVETERRGPGSVIIGDDLTYLFGTSAIAYTELLEKFKAGKRDVDYNLNLSNGKYAADEETKQAFDNYMSKIDKYNEKVTNGEKSDVKMGDLLNEYQDTFYDEELEEKLKKNEEEFKNREKDTRIDDLINNINDKLNISSENKTTEELIKEVDDRISNVELQEKEAITEDVYQKMFEQDDNNALLD